MAKYKTVEKNGVTYYRTTFTYNEKKYDLIAKTTQELDDKVQKKKQALEENDTNNAKIKLDTWALQWLETYKKPHISEKNYKNYRSIINNRIIPTFGKMAMVDIQQIQLQKFLNGLSQYSYDYVNYVKKTLTGIFSSAVSNRIIKINPSLNLEVSKKLPKGTHRVITDTEERELLKVCETHRFGLFPLIMLYCGLRNGEVLALAWEDVDIDNCIINVSKAIESGTKRTKDPKTVSGNRRVPIPEIFLERLKKEKEGKNPKDLVVTKPNGELCSDRYADRYWGAIKKQMDINMGAKLKGRQIVESVLCPEGEKDTLTPYCLRHTYCTNLFKAGVHINIAKYLMGHSSIKMVTEVYGHQTEDLTLEALRLINNYNNYIGKMTESVTKSVSENKNEQIIR